MQVKGKLQTRPDEPRRAVHYLIRVTGLERFRHTACKKVMDCDNPRLSLKMFTRIPDKVTCRQCREALERAGLLPGLPSAATPPLPAEQEIPHDGDNPR